MRHKAGHTPPKWADRLIAWYCKPELLEDLQGDLHEYFERNLKAKGVKKARWLYIIDAIKFMRPYTIKRINTPNQITQSAMLQSHIKVIFRNLARNKAFSFINITGLAISLAVCLLSISFLTEVHSYDRFNEKSSRIYRLTSQYQRAGQPQFSLASSSIYAAKRIKENYPEIEDLTMLTYGFEGNVLTSQNDYVSINGHWASESFFDVFSFDLIQGNPTTALKEPNSLVLTERVANSLFGEQQALGKTVRLAGDKDYIVTGVMENVPVNSHIQFEVLCSFKTKEIEERENDRFEIWTSVFQHYTYLVLPENFDPALLESKLISLSQEENAKEENRTVVLGLQPLTDIVIGTPLMNGIGFSIESQTVFIVVGLTLIIMLAACFNYTNLSLARSFKRTREIGVRKALGSGRQQIFRLFLTEALVISLLALAIAYLIFELVKGQALNFDTELQQAVSFSTSPQLYAMFIGFALFIGLAAGLVPALLLSKTKTTNALKGALIKLRSTASWNMRKVLLVVQYTLSLGFILAATIAFSQYKYAVDYDLGFETSGVINLSLDGQDPQIVANEFSKIPEIQDISKSMIVLGTSRYLSSIGTYNQRPDSTSINYNVVDHNYLDVHGFEFLAGSNFEEERQTSGNSTAIVNETFLNQFGVNSPLDAIGKLMTLSGKEYRIQAVVKDFHSHTLSEPITPFAFLSNGGFPNAPQSLNLKVATDNLPQVMARMEEAWDNIDPLNPMEAEFYDEQIKSSYAGFMSMFKIVASLALVAISIATLGLLGMAIYTAEVKLKEISIRKVLGAPFNHLATHMSKGLLLPLALAVIIAVPAVFILFDQVILTDIAFRAQISFVELAGGVGLIFVIAVLTASSQVLKTLKANPAQTLRNE